MVKERTFRDHLIDELVNEIFAGFFCALTVAGFIWMFVSEWLNRDIIPEYPGAAHSMFFFVSGFERATAFTGFVLWSLFGLFVVLVWLCGLIEDYRRLRLEKR